MRNILILLFKEGLPSDLLVGCQGDGRHCKVFGQVPREGRRGPSGQSILPVSLAQGIQMFWKKQLRL